MKEILRDDRNMSLGVVFELDRPHMNRKPCLLKAKLWRKAFHFNKVLARSKVIGVDWIRTIWGEHQVETFHHLTGLFLQGWWSPSRNLWWKRRRIGFDFFTIYCPTANCNGEKKKIAISTAFPKSLGHNSEENYHVAHASIQRVPCLRQKVDKKLAVQDCQKLARMNSLVIGTLVTYVSLSPSLFQEHTMLDWCALLVTLTYSEHFNVVLDLTWHLVPLLRVDAHELEHANRIGTNFLTEQNLLTTVLSFVDCIFGPHHQLSDAQMAYQNGV